ncbi:SMI1/KNR4 family protein [Pseudoflavonifractor capillosus]|uniref:SMI1/KNR4 family protein n=1 Tax=Pseudoflavonifractor capillosus TaxID=106588 RepID=UPI001958D7A7|nr:SMI1/KNR4 family protein [Pseudoflavonifractor capillosus]MBM6694898.1 SMI1/KNR4 family protein [Pseudoflavonifractor capillosus]
MHLTKFGSADVERITKLEQCYDLNLPVVYKEFLQKYNGGIVDKVYKNPIYVADLDIYLEMEIFYGVDLDTECFDIDYWMGQYRAELPEKSIIIGDDISKGFLVLICEGENKGLYYWDDECNYSQSEQEGNAYCITQDLSLLEKILYTSGTE